MGVVEMSCLGGGVEDDGIKEQRRQNKIIDQQLRRDKKAYRALHRLLLLGESLSLCFCPSIPLHNPQIYTDTYNTPMHTCIQHCIY